MIMDIKALVGTFQLYSARVPQLPCYLCNKSEVRNASKQVA